MDRQKRSIFSLQEIQQVFDECMQFNDKFPQNITLTNSQLKSIQATLHKKDVLCVLPTGSGKTFCMILPTILDAYLNKRRATTIIISPLDALMDDMERRIKSLGYFAKTFRQNELQLNLSRHLQEQECSSSSIDSDASRLLFEMPEPGPSFIIVSPEALLGCQNKGKLFQLLAPYSVCIDEGHCVQLWGCASDGQPAFREAYGRLSAIRCYTSAPLAVLTATITKEMMNDLVRRTCLVPKNLVKVVEVPDRANLFLNLKHATRKLHHLQFLLTELKEMRELTPKTIIFVNAANDADPLFFHFYGELGDDFRTGKNNRLIGVYTASMGPLHKKSIALAFAENNSSLRVLISTVAFGMGVDISSIRRVILWGIPSNAVTCWQEIGRCGRDGLPGEIIIYPFRCHNVSSGKFTIPDSVCVRKTILSNFIGSADFQTTIDCACKSENCVCLLCMCCSYCRQKCPCRK